MKRIALLILFFAPVFALAGDLKIVGDVKVPRDRMVKLSAEGVDAKAGIIWRVYPRSVDRADTAKGKLQFVGKPGQYTVELLTVRLGADGSTEVDETSVTVVVGDGTPTPTPDDPPVPPAPGGSLYFVIVRHDQATQELVNYLGNAGWAELAKAGHRYKDKTVSEAAALGITIPNNTPLPCLVTLRVSADGKSSRVVRGPIALPSPELIEKLPEGLQ